MLQIDLGNLKWHTGPFEWVYLEDVFDNYEEMLNLPKDYFPYKRYPNRKFNRMEDPFWSGVRKDLERQFINATDVKLMQDEPGYSIGPHTDGPRELYTFLFYLTDKVVPDAGTSIYTPKKEGFECDGSRHHDFEDFEKVMTVPYAPNTGLGFKRSNNSFHGVEPVGITRNLIHLAVFK